MPELVASLISVLLVAAFVWRISVGPRHRAKHAAPRVASHEPARAPQRSLPAPPRSLPAPPEPMILIAREADEQPPRTLSLARIVLVIVIVGAAFVLVVWILGFFVNLQLARYFGR
jgi:Flp pilus assembly protein TadB